MAATLFAAEFGASRCLEYCVAAASPQIVGRRRGRQLGLISFVASEARYDAAEFHGLTASHRGWGLQRGDSTGRRIQAFRAYCDLPSSLHVLARESGASPVRLFGILSDVSLSWIMNYLFSSAAFLPIGQGAPPVPSPIKGSPPSEAKSRRGSEELK